MKRRFRRVCACPSSARPRTRRSIRMNSRRSPTARGTTAWRKLRRSMRAIRSGSMTQTRWTLTISFSRPWSSWTRSRTCGRTISASSAMCSLTSIRTRTSFSIGFRRFLRADMKTSALLVTTTSRSTNSAARRLKIFCLLKSSTAARRSSASNRITARRSRFSMRRTPSSPTIRDARARNSGRKTTPATRSLSMRR